MYVVPRVVPGIVLGVVPGVAHVTPHLMLHVFQVPPALIHLNLLPNPTEACVNVVSNKHYN